SRDTGIPAGSGQRAECSDGVAEHGSWRPRGHQRDEPVRQPEPAEPATTVERCAEPVEPAEPGSDDCAGFDRQRPAHGFGFRRFVLVVDSQRLQRAPNRLWPWNARFVRAFQFVWGWLMSGGGNWIKDHKKELAIGGAVLGTALTAGAAAPALLGAAGATGLGAAGAGAAGAGTLAGLGGGTASLFGAGAADAGLAGSLLGPAAATPTLAALEGAGTAAGAGMGGGTAALFGAGQLPADAVGPSMLGQLKLGLSKAQPFIKGMAQAQQQMGGQQQVAPPAGPPPPMQQQAPQMSSAQILGGQGPSAQIAGALPPGSQRMTPEMLAMLLKMRGLA